MSSHSINLVAALPAEAKPIASRFHLERVQPDLAFPLYRKEAIYLVVSGPGKVNAAAATSFLGALLTRAREAIWINLGIAGHAERAVGEVLLASRIADAGSGRVWYPIIGRDQPCPMDSLHTLDQPDTSYRREGMVDMEASGFFPTACRYSNSELVQVLKVISDNRGSSADSPSARQVRQLMDKAVAPLETLLAHLQACAEARRAGCGVPAEP